MIPEDIIITSRFAKRVSHCGAAGGIAWDELLSVELHMFSPFPCRFPPGTLV